MVFVINDTPETCVICGDPLTYVKGIGWHCRHCDDTDEQPRRERRK